MAKLAVAAGLPDEPALNLTGAAKGFAVGDTGHPNLGPNTELAAHTVDQHFKVQLTHARHDGLARLVVNLDHESGVFVGQFTQRVCEAVLVSLGHWLDGHRHNRFRELGWFQDHRLTLVADGIARECVLQTDRGADVSGGDLLQFLPGIGVHPEQAAHALAALLGNIVHHGSGFNRA